MGAKLKSTSMPRFFDWLRNGSTKETIPVNRFEGITQEGAIVLRDRRGTLKAELPNITEKSETLGNDPLAIYKPTGAKNIDAAKAMGNFTGWTYAAVNAISSEVANIQIRLFQVVGNDHQEVDDHELLDLLESPNETMTGIDLKYTMMAHLELTGNFYGLLDGAKDAFSPPRALYPLNPGRMKVKPDKSSFPYKLSHFEYTIDGKVYSFAPYQILHIKYPDPNDPYVGIGVPQTIPVWIDSDNYAMEYNRKYFLNGAQIGLYVQSDTNVEGNVERIKRGMRDAYGGVENAHKIPVMPKGVKLEHTGVTHKDMDFQNLAEATRDRILAGFRVSKTILGTAESDTNRATAETADYVFSKRTIKPKMLLVTSYLNAFLVPRYGEGLYLTFIDPTPEDKAAKVDEMNKAVGNMPVITQNEARQNYLGFGPVEGGDKLMVPAGMEPAGQTSKVEGEDITPNLAKTAEGWSTRAIRVRMGSNVARNSLARFKKSILVAFKKQIDATPAFQVKHLKDLTHSEYMEHWKRFADRSERSTAELHAVFQEINNKQKEDVLEKLPDLVGQKRSQKAAQKALADLFDLKEWIGITVDLATPILTSLTKDEAAAALAMIGAKPQDILASASVRNALEQGISKMARSYNETTLQQLKDKLGEKLTQQGGTSLTELTQTVDGVYSYADERRAGLIAKTESFRAANFANKAAWQQSGVVKTVMWYTAADEKVCEYCQEQDGKEIDISDNFYNSGDTIGGADGGSMTADYGDIGGPPLHPDCRCYLRPEEISTE